MELPEQRHMITIDTNKADTALDCALLFIVTVPAWLLAIVVLSFAHSAS